MEAFITQFFELLETALVNLFLNSYRTILFLITQSNFRTFVLLLSIDNRIWPISSVGCGSSVPELDEVTARWNIMIHWFPCDSQNINFIVSPPDFRCTSQQQLSFTIVQSFDIIAKMLFGRVLSSITSITKDILLIESKKLILFWNQIVSFSLRLCWFYFYSIQFNSIHVWWSLLSEIWMLNGQLVYSKVISESATTTTKNCDNRRVFRHFHFWTLKESMFNRNAVKIELLIE